MILHDNDSITPESLPEQDINQVQRRAHALWSARSASPNNGYKLFLDRPKVGEIWLKYSREIYATCAA